MKKILVLAAFCTVSAGSIAWKYPVKAKPSNSASVSSLKLAEAKAILSKANTRYAKSNLGTADGGI